jgi:SSS family solute:Na+ symporter
MNFNLLLLLAYSVGLMVVGLLIGRRVGTSGAFFVAGRRLGPLLVFSTILAANIGAGSTVGAAGLGYRDGLSAWWWVGSAGIGTLVLAIWIGPKIWRIARDHDLYTVGDYLEQRYGRSVRAVIAVLLWLGTLAILAGQLIAVAWVLNVVAGVPKVVGCLIGGGVMTIYFAAGGLLTSAWVNLVELVVLLVGFAIALPWVLVDAGGWSALQAAAPAGQEHYFGFWEGGRSGWVYLALLAPAFIVSPGLLQKVYGARDERTVRLGVGLSGAALLVFAFFPPLLGMLARVYDTGLANPELALPTVLMAGLPAALGGIGLAAVFSAELSSADAILFMLSTSLSEDLYRRFVRPNASDRAVLRVARGAAVGGGALGVALAIVLPSVIGSLSVFYSLLGVSLFVPVVAGLYTRRPGVPEAMAAICGGVVVAIVLRLSGVPVAGFWNVYSWGLLVSGALFAAVFVVLRARARGTPDSPAS